MMRERLARELVRSHQRCFRCGSRFLEESVHALYVGMLVELDGCVQSDRRKSKVESDGCHRLSNLCPKRKYTVDCCSQCALMSIDGILCAGVSGGSVISNVSHTQSWLAKRSHDRRCKILGVRDLLSRALLCSCVDHTVISVSFCCLRVHCMFRDMTR
ncbi:hypothetical protein Tco_0242134 [Tanacetum coccineum]